MNFAAVWIRGGCRVRNTMVRLNRNANQAVNQAKNNCKATVLVASSHVGRGKNLVRNL